MPFKAESTLPSLKGLDNVSHDGKEKHENNLHEQNIVASLKKFDGVFKRIMSELATFKYVVVTADHGVSELAVITGANKLCKAIKINTPPNNIRYTKATHGMNAPQGVETYHNIDENINYWVAKGYNRFNKKGKMPSHGGASLEERLVPIIVFTRDELTQEETSEAIMQITENPGFDDI